MPPLARLVARHPLAVLAAVLALAAAALVPASRVRLETSLVALLPDGMPAADDYRAFLDRFGGLEKVFILVEAEGPGHESELADAAALLVDLLEASPEVASARCGVEPEDEAFFLATVARRALLLLPEDQLLGEAAPRLEPEAIRRRVTEVRDTLLSPTGTLREELLANDPLGLSDSLRDRLIAGPSIPLDPLTMTFMTPAGDTALVLVEPAGSEIDPAAGRALLATLERAFERVRGEAEAPLNFSAIGGPLYAAHDERVLRQDLAGTLTGSLAGCGLILLAAFGGPGVPLAGLVALAVALLWTAAFVGLTIGTLAAPTLGFAAILVGLGVDYAIHGGSRFRHELLSGGDRASALGATFNATGVAILGSALTTAVAFAALTPAHLRPLRELGLVVAVGMVAVLVATPLAGGALAVLAPPPRAAARPGLAWRAITALVEGLVDLAVRYPRAVTVTTALVSLGVLPGALGLRLDPDLRSLRPSDHPAMVTEQTLVEKFGVGLDTATVVVPATDLTGALSGAARVDALLLGSLGPGAQISSPSRWLVDEGARSKRLAALGRLPLAAAAGHLRVELRRAGLDPAGFAPGLGALEALADGRDPWHEDRAARPEWLQQLVREGDGGAWAAVRVRLPAGAWPEGPPAELVGRIREAAPGAAVASAVLLGHEMAAMARADMNRLGLLALAGVVVVVTVTVRGRPLASLLGLLPVLLGTLWTLGLWGLSGRGLDLIGLAVLPILLGIGIDDGLHVVVGALRNPTAGIAGSAREAGRAMVLTSLTTSVGFGSLALSHVPGLQRAGQLVAAGMVACLLATLVALPALDTLIRSRRADS